jgi:hypothetical protein
MKSIAIQGQVDEQHRLSAMVPHDVPPGPVSVWLTPMQEDDAGVAWSAGISRQWSDELADSRQDIYTPADGEPLDSAR